jgi:hypothetical protein
MNDSLPIYSRSPELGRGNKDPNSDHFTTTGENLSLMQNAGNQNRMTVREIAEALGVSDRVVQLSAKKLYPETVKNGKATYLNESQVTEIKKDLQGHHNLEGTFEVAHDLTLKSKVENAVTSHTYASLVIDPAASEVSA